MKINSEEFFFEFKEKIYKNNNFKLMARPDQDLKSHVLNMLSEVISYFNAIPPFESKYAKFLYWSSIISILCHDIGKITPFFQYKIYHLINNQICSNPIPKNLLKFTFHTLFGVLLVNFFIDHLKTIYQEQFPFDDVELSILKTIVANSIYSHHKKIPQHVKDILLENEEYYKILFNSITQNIFKQIQEWD
ncbi:MAG: HD domain-containing protein, partial [Promethearchaeota archaeon]